MQGKILKGIAGFYYVHNGHSRIYECKAKGIFRNQNVKPLVGDDVEIAVLDEELGLGNITEILTRKNSLIRPAVSNIDQAMIIFAARSPAPNMNLLDRFLIMMEKQNLPVVICFNKSDLSTEQMEAHYLGIYRNTGYVVHFISVHKQEGIEEIRSIIKDKTTVLSGPSGVGKSSLMNLLLGEAEMETGAISEKIQRGRHTTRHSQLFYLEKNTFLLDTPGFTSLRVDEIPCQDLKNYYPEFQMPGESCRFLDCVHVGEKDCGIKQAVEAGEISQERYDNYLQIYNEIKGMKQY